MKTRWWAGDTGERYWMESTDRPKEELGGDLWNWAEGIGGGRIAPAELLDEMQVDDIVFHYYTPDHAIVGYSRVVSKRASHGRQDDGQRDGRAWIARKIGGYRAISPPVTLADIQAESSSIFNIMDAIKDRGKGPYFLPIIRHRGEAAPPTAYISKVPREMVELLGLLEPADTARSPIGTPRKGPKPRPSRPSAADPFPTDPDKIDRGTQAHHDIEEALADFVVARDAQTLNPKHREPPFDLAWSIGGEVSIAEVKSTTAANERAQLRYGLGQLLRYAQEFASIDPPPNLVLVVERPVTDAGWVETCRSVGVTLTWPAAFR